MIGYKVCKPVHPTLPVCHFPSPTQVTPLYQSTILCQTTSRLCLSSSFPAFFLRHTQTVFHLHLLIVLCMFQQTHCLFSTQFNNLNMYHSISHICQIILPHVDALCHSITKNLIFFSRSNSNLFSKANIWHTDINLVEDKGCISISKL
jgi:hypothetical protein